MINAQHKQPLRTGAIASFPNLEALKRGFDKVAGTLPLFDPVEYQQRYGANNQPPNVLNMALRVFNEADDMSGPFVITDPLPMPPPVSDMSY